jgi:hypothetical protein
MPTIYTVGTHPELSPLSRSYAELWGRLPMCYAPVCHGSKPIRLACLKHVASVHPEPGSNSQKMRS